MHEAGNSEFHRRIADLIESIEDRPYAIRPPTRDRRSRPVIDPQPRQIRDSTLDDLIAQFEDSTRETSPRLRRAEPDPEPLPASNQTLDELFAQFEENARVTAPPAPSHRERTGEPKRLPPSPALEALFAELEKETEAPPPAIIEPLPADEPPAVEEATLDAASAGLDRALNEATRPLYEVRAAPLGRALFACRPIPAGTRLFGEDDWVDETEQRAFSVVTPDQIDKLPERLRKIFLHFAYNVTPDKVSGSFLPEAVRHPTNFMNHSCDPNAGYDGIDQIIALRAIAPDEEIRMDYGTYSFSFDHLFTCTCGSLWCRGRITRNDWRDLVRTGLRLPGFMRERADQALWG